MKKETIAFTKVTKTDPTNKIVRRNLFIKLSHRNLIIAKQVPIYLIWMFPGQYITVAIMNPTWGC